MRRWMLLWYNQMGVLPGRFCVKQAAFMYDFDRTLSVLDMKDYAFFPLLGVAPKDFWAESDALARREGMDQTLAYMYLMLVAAKRRGLQLTRELLTGCGPAIGYFPGVETWFDRMNAHAQTLGIALKHYVISAGIDEIIRGSMIANKFDDIFACKFHYGPDGVADWPALNVSHTMKTQYIFRINKGIHEVSEDAALNRPMAEEQRAVPFSNMVFIGDGVTDVPAMQVLRRQGGRTAAVYTTPDTVQELLDGGRVDIVAQADYRAGSELDAFATQALSRIAGV